MLSDIEKDLHRRSPSGYYRVRDNIYINKSEALTAASVLNVYPKWNYFNDIWDQQEWSGPVNENIYDLYQRRAKHLRETYDYICLAFSGGADSTTMLDAFIDGGVFVDEILVRWPIRATENHIVTTDTASTNFLSEWQLTMVPLLEHYQKLLPPNTKISIMDWSDKIFEKESPEQLIWASQDYFNPATYIKHSLIPKNTIQAIESGKKTCVLYGVDRPVIAHYQGQIFCVFKDTLAHTQLHPPYDQHVEFFYWSPNFPQIVPCQARIIYQHLLENPKHIKFLEDLALPGNKLAVHRTDTYHWADIVRNLVYPRYMKQNWFQAKKSSSRVHSNSDEWMLADKSFSRYIQSWRSHVEHRFSKIDPKFIERHNGQLKGYLEFYGSVHRIGHIPDSVLS